MPPATSSRDDHKSLVHFRPLYTEYGSRRVGQKENIVNWAVKDIQRDIQLDPEFLALVETWIDRTFLPEGERAETSGLSASDPKLLAVFFEHCCRVETRDHPEEYIVGKRREFLRSCAAQSTRVSGHGGHNTRARGRGVDTGRGRGSGGARVRSRDQEHSNPKRLKVAEASKGPHHSRSKLRESDESSVAKLGSGDISSQVANDLPNVLQQPGRNDHPDTKRRDSNPKRLKITEKSRGRPRKYKLHASDEAPAAKRTRTRKSSGDIASQLANDLPNLPQIPSPDVHSDAAPSLHVRTVSDANHTRLTGSSQSHVHNTIHAGRGKQVLANGGLSLKRGREDGDLPFNNSRHFLASSSKLSIATPLPQSTRPVRPFPRKVSTKRISLRHGQQINSAAEPLTRVLDREDVDCLVKEAPLENWAEIQDNDQDDVMGVDEIENEFDSHSANDAPAPVPSYGEPVEGNAPTIQPQRPPLPSTPPIWAQSRQEVCESLDYFRSYQSGVYSLKDIVKGYLLGGSPASRDIFHDNGRLIISHGGGKAESVLDYRVGPARFQQAQDQEVTDKSVRALLKSYTDRRPLVLLVDDKYAQFPFDLGASGYTYVVLGFYWISHAWAEYQPASNGRGRVVRWKFAFRWCGQDDPWWAASKRERILLDTVRDHQFSSDGQNPSGITTVACKACSKNSPVIYSQGWMCLSSSCPSFWSLGGREPDQLCYDTAFLRPIAAEFRGLPDLRPGKLVRTIDHITTSYAFSKGWHCERCGRLSSRFKWEHWECSNCHFVYKIPGRLRVAKEFWHQQLRSITNAQNANDSGITALPQQLLELGNGGGFVAYLTFILPQQKGRIHLILATPLANKRADEIFRQYQEQADNGELLLRRYPLKNNKIRGAFLTNYFSQNSGEAYQYVGGTGNTVPFDKAPSSVCGALALIKERSRAALQRDMPFNEILSAAYMERQKMSFHSDSERGLGPVVASLSLGSAAIMHFRPRPTSKEAKHQLPIVLSLILRHGDLLIMEGHGVQQYYEHTVIPMNFRIAATARCIGKT